MTEMTDAKTDVQTPAPVATDATAQTAPEDEVLPRFRADVLLLIDLVAADSDKVELTREETLEERFIAAAKVSQAPKRSDLEAQIVQSTDEFFRAKLAAHPNASIPIREKGKDEVQPPTTREQRKVLTRRELLRSLLDGNLKAVEAAPEPEEAAEREVTPEYYRAVLDAAIGGDFGLARLESWDHVQYLHYKPLLSQSYARLLSAKNNPIVQVRETIRDSSRRYPRPTALATFADPPFNMSAEEIQTVLQALAEDPESQDIRFTESSIGNVFLYSTLYLEDAYADFLAEHIDVGIPDNP